MVYPSFPQKFRGTALSHINGSSDLEKAFPTASFALLLESQVLDFPHDVVYQMKTPKFLMFMPIGIVIVCK